MKYSIFYVAAALFAFSLTGCGETKTPQVDDGGDEGELFSNPVYTKDFPDPTIWKGDDGFYYGVCTGCRTVIKSSDLIQWKATNYAPISDTDRSKMTKMYSNLNAPDVTVVGGKRLLYVGMITSVNNVAVGVLKETSLAPGRFEYVDTLTVYPGNGVKDSSDPEVVTDENGKVWLFFGGTYGVWRLELASDGLSVKPGAKAVRVAGEDSYSGSDRSRVFEGAYLFRRGGWWYMFLSEYSYNTYHYRVVVGRSATIDGEFLAKDGKKLYDGDATPILSSAKTDYFFGPGHNGEIFTDKDGRTMMFYHCHNTDNYPSSGYIPRPLMLQEVYWDANGWPYFEGGKPQRFDFMPEL